MSDTNQNAANAAGHTEQGKPDANAPETGKPAEGKTYTQDDLERIVQGRLAKFGDYDQIKTELDELKAANQSDSEKAIEEARKAGAAEASSTLASRLLQSEARAIAAELGFHDPKDAHLHVPADLVSENGEVDLDRLQEAIEKVAADKPYLVRQTPDPTARDVGIGRTPAAGGETGSDINQLLRTAVRG